VPSAASKRVKVHFHVVINTSEFNFKPENEHVEIRFSPSALGNWNSMGYKMSIEK